jgi:hypothetical protein
VWIIYPAPAATTPGYFPIVNASTTDFSRPFAMHLPRNEVASGKPLQMQVRRLQFRTGEKTLPARQLWGAVFGELNQQTPQSRVNKRVAASQRVGG